MDGRNTRDGSGGDDAESGSGSDRCEIDTADTSGECTGQRHAGLGTTQHFTTTTAAHDGKRTTNQGNGFCWSDPDVADHSSPRRYRYPTLGSDHAAFVRARADPLACNLDNDMVLLWNDLVIEPHSGAAGQLKTSGSPPSQEEEDSIEDAYQRLFASVARHREHLEATLRDAGLDRVNELFADSDSACGALDDVRDDCGVKDGGSGDKNEEAEDDDDVFDDSGVRGSWELLSDDPDVNETGNDAVGQKFCPWEDQGFTLDSTGVVESQEREGAEVCGATNRHEKNWEQIQGPRQKNAGDNFPLNNSNTTPTEQNKNINDSNNYRNPKSVFNDEPSQIKRALSGNSSRFDSAFYDSSCSSEDDDVDTAKVADDVDTSKQGAHVPLTMSSQTLSFSDRGNDTQRMILHAQRSAQTREAGNIENMLVSEIQGAQEKYFAPTGGALDSSSTNVRAESHEAHWSESFQHETSTEQLQNLDDPTLTPRSGQSHPSPVDSPPASMDQFRPQHTGGSAQDFLHSSPILPRSEKIYVNVSPSSQPSRNVDSQTPLSLTVPAPHDHTDWNGMSILPLVACPHHHDLPVIDAPGSFSPTLICCHAPDCGKTATLDIARHMYKNCHNCRGTYYCSRRCRHQDWKRHKQDECHGSRVSSASKQVIQFCGLDPEVKASLSRLARRGYLSHGRGCVMLGFPDLCATEVFLHRGFSSLVRRHDDSKVGQASGLELLPVYVTLSELRGSKMYGGGQVLQKLMTLCETYNPDLKFLLNVGIGVRWNREQISRFQHQSTPLNSKNFRPIYSEAFSFTGSPPRQTHNQSSKEPSPSFHSATMDSGYISLRRSTSSGTSRSRRGNSLRSRSASVTSDDVGYGSLGDIRDSLSQSHTPLSPSHPSVLDNSVFHSSQPLASPVVASPLSPPCSSDNVVYYCDAEPRLRCPILQKCACLRLFNPAFDSSSTSPLNSTLSPSQYKKTASSPQTPANNFPKRSRLLWPRRCAPTLILTDVPGSWYEAQEDLRLKALDSKFLPSQHSDTNRQAVQRKARELCFANIQKRLRERGVSLRHQFPEVYSELVNYVTGDLEHFPSRVIFPVERHGKGKMFTCVLMPEAEPDLRWTQTAQLLDNLDISRARVWGPLVSKQPGGASQSFYHPSQSFLEENRSGPLYPSPPKEGLPSQELKDTKAFQSEPSSETQVVDHQEAQKVDNVDISDKTGLNHQEVNFPPSWIKDSQEPSGTTLAPSGRVCPRCLTKPSLVDGSTQTEVPTNTKKMKQTVPDLIKVCPTSSVTRRQFNTNFPIFSFDSDTLDMLTSWAQSPQQLTSDLSTLRPLLLGHLACSSLIQRYQNSSDTDVQQTLPLSTDRTNSVPDQHSVPPQCLVAKSVSKFQNMRPTGTKFSDSREHREEQKAKETLNGRDSSLVGSSGKSKPIKPKRDQQLHEEQSNVGGETPAVSKGHKLRPSQAQVNLILTGWRNSGHKVENKPVAESASLTDTPLDNVPWSCRLCSDRHPHNHPYRDPSCVSKHLRHHSNLDQPSSTNSNPYHTHRHHHLYQQLQHCSTSDSFSSRQQLQQQVVVQENVQSDW